MRARSRLNLHAYLWGALGCAGSVVLTLAGTRMLGPQAGGQQLLGPGPVQWWFQTKLVSGTVGTEIIFYAGVAAVVIAWVGLGFELRRPDAVSMRTLVVIGALWCLPLALGPPLFSRDVYSYIAQGTLLHLGHNPYQVTPLTLGHLGQQHILNAVSHTWLRTTAPYGPLFLLVVGWLVAAAGYKLVLAVILVRLLAVLGVALLMAALPPLARRLGGDPRRAVWLIALSPLVLFQLVSPGHNDILMAGVMAVGIAVALRWPLLGIAICALAATIKVPAAAGAAFIAVAWAWQTQGSWNRARVLAQSAIVFAAVLAVVSLATGVGVSWISGGLFSTPGKVHLAITPATAPATPPRRCCVTLEWPSAVTPWPRSSPGSPSASPVCTRSGCSIGCGAPRSCAISGCCLSRRPFLARQPGPGTCAGVSYCSPHAPRARCG